MFKAIKVSGGKKLSGEVIPVPNKNAILTALPACILTDDTVTYVNLPATTDVQKILEMLTLLGARIDHPNSFETKINCKNLHSYKVDKTLGSLIRSSIMFVGPLLARFGVAEVPIPGGCVLGKRAINAHVDVFSKADVEVEFFDDFARFTAPKSFREHYDIWQFEASVTASENIFMYFAGINSSLTLTDSASEPHVSQLLKFLSDMGAHVEGIGSNKVSITGKKDLKTAVFTPEPDFIDIAGLIVAAAVTKGNLRLKCANVGGIVDGMVQCFEKFNIKILRDGQDLIVDGSNDLYIDIKNSGFPLAGDDLPKLSSRPWPGFPVDALPVMATLACKTKGKLLIQNWMFETGLDFIRELNSMGANIFMADPQRVIVNGPVTFKGGRITAPDIIQACKAIFLASLCDNAVTELYGADVLRRRYPNVLDVYKSLGADIEILE